jgi:glutamate-1-semialdehyde 2,1-aminomutase
MSASDALFQRALQTAPGGVHSPVRSFRGVGGTPVFMASASGSTIVDVDGRPYTDFCLSFGPLILGHRDPVVADAVREAVDAGWTYGTCEPYSLALAEWIIACIPWVERLRFVSSGTEAVMSALRVARAATGRSRVLKFEGCYHGHADPLLVQAGSGLAGDVAASSAGVSAETVSHTVVAPLDDEQAFDAVLERVGDDLAAVIVEGVPANYGLLPPRAEWLRHVEARCRDVGALFLLDTNGSRPLMYATMATAWMAVQAHATGLFVAGPIFGKERRRPQQLRFPTDTAGCPLLHAHAIRANRAVRDILPVGRPDAERGGELSRA